MTNKISDLPVCRVLDAGARYGIHPTWLPIAGAVELHLVDADPDEAMRLADMYADTDTIHVMNLALSNEPGTLRFNRYRHYACSSIYDPDLEWLQESAYKPDEMEVVGHFEVKADTVDHLFEGRPIHFMKLDVEGSEPNVLRGAHNQLADHVLGLRCEVGFTSPFARTGTFCEVMELASTHKFEMINMDYAGRGEPVSPYALPERFGRIIATDAVWIAPRHKLNIGNDIEVAHKHLFMALFLILNNATDIGVDLLLDARRSGTVTIGTLNASPFGAALKRRVAKLFKEMKMYPFASSLNLESVFETLFEDQFPSMHKFNEEAFYRGA